MPYQADDVKDLFLQASEITEIAQRNAFLDRACQGNAELRGRVEALLHSHQSADSFLGQPAEADLAATLLGSGHRGGWTGGDAPAVVDDLPLSWIEPTATPGRIGQVGPYEIIEVIGRGGMGVVLKAYDTKLQRVVAIKSLTPMLAGNPTAAKRFLREARAAAAVSHEHVVTIFAVEENHVPPYLVMECIVGKSLQQKIDQTGPLETEEILRIGMQIAAGLAAAHKQGLIHRDIKPANILLQNGVERVTITDFGLARAIDDVTMTQTGHVAGTPEYMSPEQAQGEPLDAPSDLFSLGCVLYTLCTGRTPFRADSTMAVLRRVCDDAPRPIREINREIPEVLVRIIDKLLAKRPDDRFQSAAEVADLLSSALAWVQQPAERTPPYVPQVTPPQVTSPQVTPSRPGKPAAASRLVWIPAVLALVLFAFWAILLPTFRLVVLDRVRIEFPQLGEDSVVDLFRDGQRVATQVGSGRLEVPSGWYEFRVRTEPDRELLHFYVEHRDWRYHRDQWTFVSPPQGFPLERGDQLAVWVTLVEVPAKSLLGPSQAAEPIDPRLAVAPFDEPTAREFQQLWAEELGVPIEFSDPLGIDFRLIPAGIFQMGSSPDQINAQVRELELQEAGEFEIFSARSSGPQHQVRLTRPYYLAACEITRAQFRTFVEETGYRSTLQSVPAPRFTWQTLSETVEGDSAPEDQEENSLDDKDRRPVIGVSWEDAQAFCRWLSRKHGLTYQLPSEAQWEFACRAGSDRRWSFGDDTIEMAAYALAGQEPGGYPEPVGGRKPNPFGLYDMHGNAGEWCLDWHHSDYYGRSPTDDPVNLAGGTDPATGRVIRGGSWNSGLWRTQSASRTYDFSAQPVNRHGFRVAIVGDLSQVRPTEVPEP